MKKRAAELFQNFNRKPFSGFRSIDIDFDDRDLVDLGRCIAVVYASRKEGKKIRHYEHKFGAGARLLCTDNGKTLIIIGEKIRVTDWIRG